MFVALACLGPGALSALAAPPILVSSGQTNRHPTATWTLPSGVESQFVEVASSPETDANGWFASNNVVIFETVGPAQTTWTASRALAPGRYYLHIAGFDPECFYGGRCPVRESR